MIFRFFFILLFSSHLYASNIGVEMTGCKKQDYLWNKILKSKYSKNPELKEVGVKQVAVLVAQGIERKMLPEKATDEKPSFWSKPIHAHGSVAKIKFISNKNHHFTGLFEGSSCGLARLSLTYKPDEKRGFAPGAAFKFFVEGEKSKNFSMLPSLKSQGQNFNFFSQTMSNIVQNRVEESTDYIIFHKIFRYLGLTKYPEMISVSSLAYYNENGHKEMNPESPFHLLLDSPLKNAFEATPSRDFRDDLKKLKKGDVLYRVYASSLDKAFPFQEYKDSLKKELIKDADYIGDIVLESSFVTSEFGDETLFFPHTKMEVEFK